MPQFTSLHERNGEIDTSIHTLLIIQQIIAWNTISRQVYFRNSSSLKLYYWFVKIFLAHLLDNQHIL